jgi:tRNA (guanine-N7-)-methyltransferase
MSRSLKYEIPGVDPRVSVIDVAEKGWDTFFRPAIRSQAHSVVPRRRVLEIGFGRGEFLLAMAERAPESEFIGIEVSFKRTLKMARKVARAGLENVRLVEARAEVAIVEFFQPGELSEVWVNFTDPWPKARHAHRRVIQPTFVANVARALCDGGVLYVATDDVRYAHQIDGVLAGEKSLFNQYAPWPYLVEVPGRISTGYEEQWRATARPLHFFAYGTTAEEGRQAPEGRDR